MYSINLLMLNTYWSIELLAIPANVLHPIKFLIIISFYVLLIDNIFLEDDNSISLKDVVNTLSIVFI